jgi:hypothetical protein
MKTTNKNMLKTSAMAFGLLSLTGMVYAQDSVTMAPPIQGDNPADAGDVADNASQDTVFNWTEVPANQRVEITRAVFDKGGYQLYDNVGETIIVPFNDNNLYVMKFGISDDGSTYFINDGSAPTLYLPHDGYLENATVTGAKWYPFPQDYHPAEPVFLGIAPSWDSYVDMGWYPDMVYYGGYYSHHAFISGGIVFPTFGLFVSIGGSRYYGWADYRHYYDHHPDSFHVTVVNHNFYRWGGHPYAGHAAFFGGDHFNNHDFGGDNHFGGRGFQGDGHRTFGNVNGNARPFGGGNDYHSFGSHTFRGGQNFGNNASHFGGGDHNFGNSNSENFGGVHRFSGSDQNSANGHSDGFNGGGHSFSGGGGGFHGGGGNRTSSHANGHARPSGGNNNGDHSDHGGGGGDHGGGGGDHGGGGGDHGGGGGGHDR